MSDTQPTEEQVSRWMEGNGFKYHVDVLNRYWEKGDFHDRKNYIKVTDQAAIFFYHLTQEQVAAAREDELRDCKKSFADRPDQNYTGQQVHQVLDARLNQSEDRQ